MDIDNAPPVDTVAMAAAAFAFTAKRELPSSSLPSPQQIGNLCAPEHMPPQASASAAAVAPPPAPAVDQGLQLEPAAASAPAGRDENIVRALAFAEDGSNGVRKGTANDAAAAAGSGGGGRAEGGDNDVSALEEIVVHGACPEADVAMSRHGEPVVPPAAAAGGRAVEDAIDGSICGMVPEGLTKGSCSARSLTASSSAGRRGLANSEDDVASAMAAGNLGRRADGGSAAGSAGEDEDDVGSGDEDNDDYTWFSSERRVSGGERKHGRGRLGGDKVYDRIRINDNAEEMNALRQQLADGTVAEGDGRKRLRELEDEVFTVKVGDTIEINSGNDSLPYVGKLEQLDRRTKRFRVRWYFVGHEVERHLRGGLKHGEILLSDRSSDQPLDTINRKVETVSEMPLGGKLPPNTYLCYRGYDMRRKEIVPLLGDGSLDRRWRSRVNQKTKKELARAAGTSRASSTAGADTPPPRSSAASTIMSPSQEDSDSDRPQMVLLERWNRVGPEFDVAVPVWTGPQDGRLAPPVEEREVAQKQFNHQHRWSSRSLPFSPADLEDYLDRAKAIAPIFPGTIVYIRPHSDGRWGDGSDRKQARPPHGVVGGTKGSGSGIIGTSATPRLSSMARSTFRWGLVSEPSLTTRQEQLAQEGVRGRRSVPVAGAVGAGTGAAASSVGMVHQAAAPAGVGAGVPLAPRPQWLVQQQQQQQLHAQQQQQMEAYAQQMAMQNRYRALFGNADSVSQPPQPPQANQLRHQERLQHDAGGGGFSELISMSGLGALVPPAGSAHPSSTGSSSAGIPAMPAGLGGNGAAAVDTVVWIANPVDENTPLKVERSRVMGREFEEEAMNILWDTRGSFDLALATIGSKGFHDDWRKRLEAAGEVWTFQQVEAAVKSCNKMATDRRNHQPGEMGDECTDEQAFGIASKPFRSVLDFERRYAGLARFGQPAKRRTVVSAAAATAAAAAAAVAAAAAAATAAAKPTGKRARPKQGTYNDARPKRPAAAGASSGGRGTGRTQGQGCRSEEDDGEDEQDDDEDEEQEESSEDSEDTNYDPNDSEGSSLIWIKSKGKRRRRSREEDGDSPEAAGSGVGVEIGQEEDKDNDAEMKETTSNEPIPPSYTPPPLDEIHDLCSSDEEDVNVEEPDAASAETAAPPGSPPPARGVDETPNAVGDGYAMAPATAAEVAAAAASRETRGVAAEAAARAEADGAATENGGAAATAGGGGGVAGLPSSRPKEEVQGGVSRPGKEGDGGKGSGDTARPPREDSPVPGVASGNTGGEAMAPRPQDETGSVLHIFMRRVKATLNQERFDKFVSALSQYRENTLEISELVEAVGECFNHREEVEIKLVHEFNSFLPPGHAVKFSDT